MDENVAYIVLRTDVEGCLLNEDKTTKTFKTEQEVRDFLDSADITEEDLANLEVVMVAQSKPTA